MIKHTILSKTETSKIKAELRQYNNAEILELERNDEIKYKMNEIIDLIHEVNRDILDNSDIYRFEIKINTERSLDTYLINTSSIESVEIRFIEMPSFTRSVSIIYSDLSRLSKESVLDWMTSVIFKEL